MKKIFYSIMAVALCACSQSDVDDNTGIAPQPENNGVTFTVVDNGFVGEDGTRVTYGEYGAADAYQARFEEGDQIGVYALKTTDSNMVLNSNHGGYEPTDKTVYIVENAQLTLTNGVWKGSVDFKDADLLFAYAPYRPGASIEGDHIPSFTGAKGSWVINKTNNRFFVGGNTYNDVTNNSALGNFKDNDWMGAAVNLTGNEETITFNMEHMRGMIELTTPKEVKLTNLTLKVGYYQTPYPYGYYIYNENQEDRTQNVYRILTTEYRDNNTLCATIEDGKIVKKYQKQLTNKGVAGYCSRVNINYTPATEITLDGSKTLAQILAEKFDDAYATAPNPTFTSLRLAGTLKGNGNTDDWATLKSLTTLTTLDMSELTNTEIPSSWLAEGETAPLYTNLTTLVLPNGLTTIGNNALQVGSQLTSIELPASVTTINGGAFYHSSSSPLSICIPENSNLQTIGDGAFVNANAVYTDKGNINVLKIPTHVTKIDANAFGGVSQLRKVVFQTETAPETINKGTYTRTFGNSVIYVPKREGYEGKFSDYSGTRTIIVGPILTADNYASDYTLIGTGAGDGIGVLGLCDNDNSTFWHTKYGGSAKGDATYGQYIDITLPEAMTSSMIRYITRSYANAVPAAVDIYTGNDGENWTKIATLPETNKTLPTTGNGMYTTEKLTSDSFTRIRFAITANQSGTLCGESIDGRSVALAELTIGEEIWTE